MPSTTSRVSVGDDAWTLLVSGGSGAKAFIQRLSQHDTDIVIAASTPSGTNQGHELRADTPTLTFTSLAASENVYARCIEGTAILAVTD